MRNLKIDKKVRKYALLAVLALMLISVVALADVIYYYKGVITATVTKQPLEFYSGSEFKYNGEEYPLNSYVSKEGTVYADFDAESWGFTAQISISNASYIYFYHALGLVPSKSGSIYVANVEIPSSNEIIKQLTIIIQDARTDQSVCSFTVISNGAKQTPTSACTLSADTPYYISILVKPMHNLSPGLTETITIYFGYNIVSNAAVPLPPISG